MSSPVSRNHRVLVDQNSRSRRTPRIAILLALLLSILLPGLAIAHVTAQGDATSNVPMFRGNPARTGALPGPGPDPNEAIVIRWTFPTEKFISSSPAVAGGVVYIGSRDGNLYAIDALSGQPKWTFALGYTDSSPAVVDGVVYAGNSDNSLYAIDAATGQQIWALEIGGDISDALVSSPAVVDGVVYVGSTDANLYAVDAASGQQIWAVTIGEIASSPAVADDVVYVSTRSLVLYALDAGTGQEKWAYEDGDLGISYRTSPAVADGTAYLFSNYDNDLHAIDTASGQPRWQFPIPITEPAFNSMNASPAVADGVVYAGGSDSLYAIDAATGQQIWSFPAQGLLDSSPVVVDGLVYVSSSWGDFYAIDAASGQQAWTRSFDADVVSSPAVADGIIYIGIGGTLYALGNPSPAMQTATAAAQATATAQANEYATAVAVAAITATAQAHIDATSTTAAGATVTIEAQAMATSEAIEIEWQNYFWTEIREAFSAKIAKIPGMSLLDHGGPGGGGALMIPPGWSHASEYPIAIAGGSASAEVTLLIFPSKPDADTAMEAMSGGLIRSGWESRKGEGLDHNHACLTVERSSLSEAVCYMTRDDALIISYSTIGLPNPDAALMNAIDLANAMDAAYDQVDRPE